MSAIPKSFKTAGGKSLKAAGKENKPKPAEVVKVASAGPVEEGLASRSAGKLMPCKICVAKGEGAGCQFCIAKAAALDLIDAAGGDIVEAAAAAEKKCKAKPFCVVDVSCLKKMEEDGGRIIKEASKEGVVGKVVSVRLADSNVKSLMRPLPRPFSPLPEDYFQEHPNLREPLCVSAAAVLYSLSRKESVLAQFYEKGYAVVDFELANSY